MHEETVRPSPGQTLEPLLSVNDTAALLRTTRSTVYELIRSGDLRPVRVGRRLRFRPADIETYLSRGDP
ncbi:MAG: helix-turn-helix domain-containing protein [Gaiella sp.]